MKMVLSLSKSFELNFVIDQQKREVKSNQTRHQEGKSEICQQCFPIQWLYMELWCLATSTYK